MELLMHPGELLMVFLVIFAFIYGSLLLDDWLDSKKTVARWRRDVQEPQQAPFPIQDR